MNRKAVLLVNLGSPDSPSVRDVRRYLAEFLMDPYVLDVPALLRALIVYGAILPFRPKESAHAYASIWTPEGSPLVTMSASVQSLLAQQLPMPVGLAMRYGSLSIKAEVCRLLHSYPELDEIVLVPLYPQFAMSSYQTVVEETNRVMRVHAPHVALRIVEPFYQHARYIEALHQSIERAWEKHPWDCLLFSYHGIPERHLRKSDPTKNHCLIQDNCCSVDSKAHETCYRHQCYTTTRLAMASFSQPQVPHWISFQSRLGRDPWLQPYTDFEVVRLAESGVKRLAVICPAFVSDCLETLEEINDRARQDYIKAGGESFYYIPCLNDHPDWIAALTEWVQPADGVCDKMPR